MTCSTCGQSHSHGFHIAEKSLTGQGVRVQHAVQHARPQESATTSCFVRETTSVPEVWYSPHSIRPLDLHVDGGGITS
jgi:hypothetical protein